MTRDQAVSIANQAMHKAASPMECWIDAFVALGMLKVDESKSATEVAVTAMFNMAIEHGGMLTPRHAMDAITRSGCKVVFL